MSQAVRFTTLDDAFFFLNQSKGMSEIPHSQPLRQRYIRACILFSWVALEESVNHTIDELQQRQSFQGTSPARLSDKLEAALRANSQTCFVASDFNVLRRVRNSLTHPRAKVDEAPLLTVDQATATFNYCSAMMTKFLRLELRWL
jgi:hypothetical protein